MSKSLTIQDDDVIKERVPGDPVPALKTLDAGLSKYDFGNVSEMVEFAKMMAQAGPMLPPHARGNAGVCLAIYMRARQWGIDPFGLAQETYQAGKDANAPVAYQARVYTAVAVNNGINLEYSYTGETHFSAAAAQSTKGNKVADQTAAGTRQVTVRAEVAGVMREYTSPMLKDIKVKNSPLWHNDPDQQLAFYAARAWMRRYRPDLMMGALSVDELQDASPMRDITPREQSVGGWGQQAQEAREEAIEANSGDVDADDPQETPDVDQADDEDQGEEVHWTDGIDRDEGFPGSEAWEAGQKAFADGAPLTDCPHEDDVDAAQDWIGGYEGARKAAL